MATKGFGVSELNVDGNGISAIESSGSLLIESNNGMSLRSVSGAVAIGATTSPETDDSYDLGSSTKRWRNIYTTDLQLSNEGKQNDVDGTWGQWTIQEGEEDLFLINRRNGKKYKFLLEEVN
jgi:hypothetical protein